MQLLLHLPHVQTNQFPATAPLMTIIAQNSSTRLKTAFHVPITVSQFYLSSKMSNLSSKEKLPLVCICCLFHARAHARAHTHTEKLFNSKLNLDTQLAYWFYTSSYIQYTLQLTTCQIRCWQMTSYNSQTCLTPGEQIIKYCLKFSSINH